MIHKTYGKEQGVINMRYIDDELYISSNGQMSSIETELYWLGYRILYDSIGWLI